MGMFANAISKLVTPSVEAALEPVQEAITQLTADVRALKMQEQAEPFDPILLGKLKALVEELEAIQTNEG